MNLKKILWAFFYTFLVLDIVLIYQWVVVNRPLTDPGSSQSVKKEMQMDGIKYHHMDSKPLSGAYLSADEDNALYGQRYRISGAFSATKSGNTLVATPKKPVNLGHTRAQAIAKLKKMMLDKNAVIDGSEYQYDRFMTDYLNEKQNASGDGFQAVFSQRARPDVTGKVFSTARARIQFTVDENYNLKNYTQTHVNHVEKLRDISSLISEEDALINAYQYNEIPNNSVVQSSQLNYMIFKMVRGDVIYVPVWSFVIKNNANEVSTISINAMNGALMH
ncbi:regulatory protein YycI of two-component signal transduction system YycFG [Weissella uvarum]|uniref:two-component system regulatory protein YycI n=1 Tax=Weissella uvarum TaxID=1479233 RepID=UPI00195F70AC|nr:two-component system regulatory protein YycI [Weissella uvarum]MBM7617650.1 regulatory protein YycI of two-component signal transduction system YycFG [Weissella uvarum]MCM0595999.1 two-component system regulatory protein YycI [Weissella uvarum]